MSNPIEGVKKFSVPMFVTFVLSKVLVGIGLGVLLAKWLAPYGWWILGIGVVVSIIICAKACKDSCGCGCSTDSAGE